MCVFPTLNDRDILTLDGKGLRFRISLSFKVKDQSKFKVQDQFKFLTS